MFKFIANWYNGTPYLRIGTIIQNGSPTFGTIPDTKYSPSALLARAIVGILVPDHIDSISAGQLFRHFIRDLFVYAIYGYLIGLSFSLIFEWYHLQTHRLETLWHHPNFFAFLLYSSTVVAAVKSIVRYRNVKNSQDEEGDLDDV